MTLIEKILETLEETDEVQRMRGATRELAIVRTKLDEAMMWENRRRELPTYAGGETEPLAKEYVPPRDPTQRG